MSSAVVCGAMKRRVNAGTGFLISREGTLRRADRLGDRADPAEHEHGAEAVEESGLGCARRPTGHSSGSVQREGVEVEVHPIRPEPRESIERLEEASMALRDRIQDAKAQFRFLSNKAAC